MKLMPQRLKTLTIEKMCEEIVCSCFALNLVAEEVATATGIGIGHSGLESLIQAQILGSWTAFEVLATDLWIEAVNILPKTLGIFAIKSPARIFSPDMSEDHGSSEEITFSQNSISLNLLAEYDFDLKTRLGEMLWRKGRFNFNSLDGLKNAYIETFCVENSKKDKARVEKIKKWFSGEDYEQLRVLEAVRNLLIHRAGKVDQPFMTRIEKHPIFSMLKKNDQILLDGEIAMKFTAAVFATAEELLFGVDVWIQQNKGNNRLD